MIEYGHICLLIFAQGTWKENYKKRFLKEVKNKFLSNMDIDKIDVWNEIEKISLFNPKNLKNRIQYLIRGRKILGF